MRGNGGFNTRCMVPEFDEAGLGQSDLQCDQIWRQGTIAINVATWKDRVWLSVYNSGNSVPEDQIGCLFEQLRRETTGGSPGWGIGLTFVKKVAKSHGGSVTIDSAPGRGTTFTIDIPWTRGTLNRRLTKRRHCFLARASQAIKGFKAAQHTTWPLQSQ